jgi:arginyl-tRNA synthetase
MIKHKLEKDLKRAVEALGYKSTDIVCDICQNSSFGDYTSNIALQLAKQNLENGKQTPLEIANEIISNLGDLSYLDRIEIKPPGFLNFFVKKEILAVDINEILESGENYGKNDFGKGKKVQVEFISANPTGPLTLANGRGGATGDTLANVLKVSGFEVDREYYVNDTGNQVRVLGDSVKAKAGKIEDQEDYYQGEYIQDLAQKFASDLDSSSQELGHKVADYLLETEIKPAVEKMGIKFDEFYSERNLHESGLIQKTADLLEEKGLAYEKDGALWFKSAQFGDEKDRVLITSEGVRGKREPTYLMPDIVHHLEIFKRGYSRRINILGADHHSYIVRLKQSVEAITKTEWMDFILIQMVKLFKDGKEFRMSKRKGNFATLDELLEAVGKDAVRFFFLTSDPNTQMNFNLDLAKEKSNKNPVYYVQYAHARMANILNKSQKPKVKGQNYGVLINKSELELIKYLMEYPELVKDLAKTYQVHKLTTYATKLADLFHKFYENCRVLNAETEELQEARFSLVKAGKIVLGNTLALMGIDAPERM